MVNIALKLLRLMKRKILIITTKNCIGCTILINNIQTVLAKSKKNITLEIKDFNEVPKRILHQYSAFDYPFVVFIIEFCNQEP